MKVRQFLKHFWYANSDVHSVYVKTDISSDKGHLIEPCEYADADSISWHEDIMKMNVNLFQIKDGSLIIHAR